MGSSLAPRRRERTGSAADHRGSVDYTSILTSPSIGVLSDPKVRYAREHRTIRALTSLRGNDREDNSRTSACNQHPGELAPAGSKLSTPLSLAAICTCSYGTPSDAIRWRGGSDPPGLEPVGTLQAETPDWLFLLRPLIALVAFNTRLWPHWVLPNRDEKQWCRGCRNMKLSVACGGLQVIGNHFNA